MRLHMQIMPTSGQQHRCTGCNTRRYRMAIESALSAEIDRNFTLTMITQVWPYGKHWICIYEKHTYKLMQRRSLFDSR